MQAAVSALGIAIQDFYTGDLSAAEDGYRRSLAGFTETGNLLYRTIALSNIGEVRFLQGRLDEARTLHEEARNLKRAIQAPAAYELFRLGLVAALQGRYQLAESLFTDAVKDAEQSRDQATLVELALSRAELALWADQITTAHELATGVASSPAAEDNPAFAARALGLLAHCELAIGETATARRTVDSAFAQALGTEDLHLELWLRTTLATTIAAGSPDQANQTRQDLAQIVERADSAGLVLASLEAQLAAATIRLNQIDDDSALKALAADSEQRGLGAYARRAGRLLATGR